jgi:RES domain-containing protein
LTGGRWNPLGAFRALYTSLDETTALEEAKQQNLRQGVPPWMALPLVVTAIEVNVHPVLDLRDGGVRRILRIPRERLVTEPWWSIQDEHNEAITQAIGRVARDQRFVALLVPAAVHASAANLVIFPDRLTDDCRLAIVHPEELPRASLDRRGKAAVR